jgi:hypothetical protein
MMAAAPSQRRIWLVLIVVVVIAGSFGIPTVRNLALKSLRSLRMQKVQAVNADFSPYVDANANPTLHQMVTQMISDKVQVEVNEEDHPVTDVAGARQLAGFDVLLLSARKDTPTLVVGGSHKIDVVVDRSRLQAIATEAGHPDIVLPQSLDGATVGVQVPRSVQLQYGTCPTAANASQVVANNITGPSPTTTQYSDCVRLREGPTPIVSMPSSLDVGGLAQIGLETAGMTPAQASDFLRTVDWKAVLTLSVPRSLRAYQTVKVDGTNGTLLSMAGRRGPGYALIWTKNGLVYSLVGFGDSSQAVGLADSLK